MRLRLSELQENDEEAKLLRSSASLPEGWEDVEGVLQFQGLPYISEIIRSEVLSRHHNDPLAGHFGIHKTRELVGRKYYWPSLRRVVKSYVRGCDVCLTSKAVCHKPYGDLQSLPIPIHRWKDLSMDFVTGLPLSADWKGDSYNLILVIVDRLTKMVYYEPVKVTIDAPELVEVIIDVVIRHHGLPDSIVTDRGSLFTSKFWSSLCYFLGVKRRLSTAFHPQTDGQTERQNSTMEAYFRAFVNFEQNDWARLLSMAEFAYNNAKNASTGHMPFELNCGFHPRMSYKEDVDPRSQSKSANELSAELKELMIVCRENLHHAQELQKRAHDKGVKPRSYAPGEKIWLNSKYIKTKRNGSWRQSSLDRSESSILSENKHTNWSFPRSGESIMFSMCHCWNKTPQGRGGYIRRTRRNWTLVTIAGNTRWKQFGTARSIRESQNRAIYQVSTIWFHGRNIQRKKIPGSQPQRSSILESISAHSSRTTLISRWQHLLQSTLHHRWLDQ